MSDEEKAYEIGEDAPDEIKNINCALSNVVISSMGKKKAKAFFKKIKIIDAMMRSGHTMDEVIKVLGLGEYKEGQKDPKRTKKAKKIPKEPKERPHNG